MQRNFQPAVYIVANKRNGAIYTGVTSDLAGEYISTGLEQDRSSPRDTV